MRNERLAKLLDGLGQMEGNSGGAYISVARARALAAGAAALRKQRARHFEARMTNDEQAEQIRQLREIGEDCQRGAFGSNLAERLWDIADKLATAALRAPQTPAGWQPIATAQKDGSRVLLYVPTEVGGSYTRQIGQWNDDYQAETPQPFWCYDGDSTERYSRAHPPTHWMALPSPPAEEPR